MRLILPRKLQLALLDHLRRAGSREIGGILMGEQVEPGTFRVADFSVDAVTGDAAHFVRSPAHHRETLVAFFNRTGHDYVRHNYVGEWHSHPSFPVAPSPADVESMRHLVDGERDITFAALLIVRRRLFRRLDAAAYAFGRGLTPSSADLSLE